MKEVVFERNISCDAHLLNELLEADIIHFGRSGALRWCYRDVGK